MKSIKEKAREYNIVVKRINDHTLIVNTQGSEKFIEGANYALEELEKIIPKKHKYLNDSGKSLIIQRIKDTIEQLKK